LKRPSVSQAMAFAFAPPLSSPSPMLLPDSEWTQGGRQPCGTANRFFLAEESAPTQRVARFPGGRTRNWRIRNACAQTRKRLLSLFVNLALSSSGCADCRAICLCQRTVLSPFWMGYSTRLNAH
jgi:hypothetical protein